jgi:hypothetical protein
MDLFTASTTVLMAMAMAMPVPSRAHPIGVEQLQPVGVRLFQYACDTSRVGESHLDPSRVELADRVGPDPSAHDQIDVMTDETIDRPARTMFVVSPAVGDDVGGSSFEVDDVKPRGRAEMTAHGGGFFLMRFGGYADAHLPLPFV